MAKYAVSVAFANDKITEVYLDQLRRKKAPSKSKHVAKLRREALKLKDGTKPTGPTNPWEVDITGAAPGANSILLFRVSALDKDGNYVATVTIPARKHPLK